MTCVSDAERVKRRSEEMLSATDAMDAAEAHVDGQNERRARESHDQLVATSQGSGLAAVRTHYYTTTATRFVCLFPLPFPFNLRQLLPFLVSTLLGLQPIRLAMESCTQLVLLSITQNKKLRDYFFCK